MKNQFWQDLGFVVRGKQRRGIVKLMDKPKTPTQLKEEIKQIHITNVCRVLRELENKGLAECVTPNFKTGRIYKLTKRGEAVKKEIGSDE